MKELFMQKLDRGVSSIWAIALGLLLGVGCLSPTELPIPARMDVIISGVTVINPSTTRRTNQSIVVRDGSILEVRPRETSDPEPICSDCYAIPGLIDAHVHTPPRIISGNQQLFALLYLAHGVTTVRDVGESEASVARLAERLNAGDLVGPQMLRCGPVLDGDPPGWPVAEVVPDAATAREIVDRLAEEGVDCIKIYNEIGLEAYQAISATARRHGLPLVGHVPHDVGLEQVADLEVQHLTGIPYLSRPRPPLGWDIRDTDVLSLSDEEIDHALDVAIRQRLSMTPTLANFSLRLSASDPIRFPPGEASQILPVYWTDAWDLIAGHPSTEEEIEQRLRAIPRMHAIARRAHERGIDLLAGTDTLMPWVVPGDALHREMAELEAALGDPELALAAATTVNGRHLGPGAIGVIAPGARADLLLVTEDPTKRLSALREWRILFADGRRYDREQVDGWMDDYRRYFAGWTQRNIIGTAAAMAVGLFSHD
jgi:hypothetical protein